MRNFNIKSKVGFTLIELLVVIGILAVLAAIAIPSVAGLIDRANVSADNTNTNEMTNSMERFVSEYELYCQDIASNMVDFDNLDATQGRVYNVTGIEDRGDIELIESTGLNGKQIDIDTKYPTNVETAQAVVENYMKTSSTTFVPKQSDMHYYYSPACGIVVCADANATVDELNALVQSGKDAKGNTLNGDIVWYDITDATSAEDGQENNETFHGLYFDETYVCNYNGDKLEAIFHEDTSAEIYSNDTLMYELPQNAISFTTEEVDLSAINFGICPISKDGKMITVGDLTFILKEENTFKFKNIKYLIGSGIYMIMNDDGSISLNHILTEENQGTLPSFCVDYSENALIISGTGDYDGVFIFADNGNYVYYQTISNNNIVALKEGICNHYTLGDWSIRREFYDNDFNIINLNQVSTLQEIAQYTLRCSVCATEIPSKVFADSDYLYLYDTFLEPQATNGNPNHGCVDLDCYEVGGYYAVPWDVTKSNNLYTSIDGVPVKGVLITNGAVISNKIEYLSSSFGYFSGYRFDTPNEIEFTYLGTKQEFNNTKGHLYYNGVISNRLAITEIQQELNSGWGDRSAENKVIVHCSDGDIVLTKK